MVLDYCERRPVSKNRPKRQPVGIVVLVLIGAVLVSFAAGFGSGWFLGSRSSNKETVAKAAAVVPKQDAAPAAPQTAPGAHDVPLTFYQTLPAGSKTVIGSGLNPGKGDGEVHKPTAAEQHPTQASAPAQQPRSQADAEQDRQEAPAPSNATAESNLCVQVASLRDRKEAEAIKAQLAAKGLAAYIVESNLRDKGTWYRVRLGKHLKSAEAAALAAKAGKGAIVTPE